MINKKKADAHRGLVVAILSFFFPELDL